MIHRAEQAIDGTFSIFDVPVFAELPKGARGNEVTLGSGWMQDAIVAAQLKEREAGDAGGYLPPLHLNHHGLDKPQRAGHFRLSRVGSMVLDGATRPVLFADLLKIPAERFAEIQAGDFPYRSVEIYKPNGDPAINSIALLDTEEPFFRFPMLNGETIKLSREQAGYTPDRAFAAHFTDKNGATAALFRMGAIEMPTKPDTAHLQDDDKDKEIERLKKKLKDTEEERDKLKAGAKAMDKDDDKSAKAMDDDDKDDDDNPKPSEPQKKTAKATAKLTAAERENVELSARIDGLEAKSKARDAADAKRDEGEAAVTRFKAAIAALDGFHLSESTKDRLLSAAKRGQDHIDEVVALYKATAARDPIQLAAIDASTKADPDAEGFGKDGPEALEAARNSGAQWDAATKRGLRMTLSRKEYIAVNVRHNGHLAGTRE